MKLLVLALFVVAASASVISPLRGALEGVDSYRVYQKGAPVTGSTTDITTEAPEGGINSGEIAAIIAFMLVLCAFGAAALYFLRTEQLWCFG